MDFYVCEHCGNIITFMKNKGVPVNCCGQKMTKLEANTSDGANEKHVPVIEQDGNKVTVTVGSVIHPMLEEHYIEWIVLETNKGHMVTNLKPGQEPVAEFLLTDGDEVIGAFEYCNLHKLWKAAK